MTCILAGLKDWQTLITGGIALFVGFMTVRAINNQIADLRAARQKDEELRREVERAYVSGGGARIVGTDAAPAPTNLFELHIINHGKTSARLHHVAVGFCDASALPPEPVYEDLFPFNDAIGPDVQSRRIGTVEIPEARYARIAICGRYYWNDIWGKNWSSGFVYEIPSSTAIIAGLDNASISIEAPPAYWDDRPGDYPAPQPEAEPQPP
jgi:hypothetical protein